jgi:hypothetical protein
MDTEIVAIYCLCDDLLKAMHHVEDCQCRMSDAEVMTTAIVAARYFGGNIEHARGLLGQRTYIPTMLSRSRLNRRLHRVKTSFLSLFAALAEEWKTRNSQLLYAVDTFPIAVCDQYRILRARLYQGEAYRGYLASKRRHFYGLKIHLLVTAQGQPVEFFLTPGRGADVSGLYGFDYHLPRGATICADKAYNDYRVEDELAESGITLLPIRKKTSKRPYPPALAAWVSTQRKVVETAGSLIQRRLPKSIHAVTAAGFELKVVLFVLCLSLHFLLR